MPKTDDQTPDPVAESAPAAIPALGDEAALRLREQAYFTRKLSAEDKARAAAKRVTMVAVTSFTIHDNADHVDPTIISRGDEFEISEFDLPKYIGRGRLKTIDSENAAQHGVMIQPG